MVSPSGHCRPFDANSGSTIFGSGVAALILKPLQAAPDDGDRIHAVIRGSATGNKRRRAEDHLCRPRRGRPGGGGRRSAGASPRSDSSTISYSIETHGTGTPLGDRSRRSRPCAGDVRTLRCPPFRPMRVGLGEVEHRTPRCGVRVAGLVKTILCLKNKAIPPTVHYTAPNPELHLDTTLS